MKDVASLFETFGDRCGQLLESQRGKPFRQAAIEYDWNERGNFTRKYAHSVTTFAMQAFHLDEDVDVANRALQELFRHYLENPLDLYESHSFHWSGALYHRLYSFFGPEGSVAKDRMDEETQLLMLEMMWAWSKKASGGLDSDTEHIWRFPNSENHHAMGIVTTWGFCGILKDQDGYAARVFDDGGVAEEHYDAWTAYFKAYFRSRAGKGQSLEIASKSYNAHTIQMWHNIFDFAEDAEVSRMSGEFLDLYWATWAEEQIDGVRGGGKNRVYQGPGSRTAAGGAVSEMASLYLQDRVEGEIGSVDWVVVTSGYQMPEPVMKIALDVEGRGTYEVIQRCMGLAESGWERKPLPPVIPFGISGLRSDFGGFLRYTYCTPDYVMGALQSEAYPNDDWTRGAAQNRWQGVIFRGHPDAAIVPECLAMDTHLNLNSHNNTQNQHWTVQKKGTLITQKLDCPRFSEQTGDSRVWISEQGLSDPVDNEGWVFVEAEGAYAAICVVDGGCVWDNPESEGRWMKCNHDLSPIIIEVGRKADYDSFDGFQTIVTDASLVNDSGKLDYTGLSGDRLTLYSDYSAAPEVNGVVVDYAPPKVYDSPFVQSDWDSGVVELMYGDFKKTLSFR